MDLPSKIFPYAEYVFVTIEKRDFQNIDATGITIKNSIIRNCAFSNVDMKHCDLLSNKIYNVSFTNVLFRDADIYSLWFNECEFDTVDFTGAGIEDIIFIDCKFKQCTFGSVDLKNCKFHNSIFQQINPVSSSFILNQYFDCHFLDCCFKGSFQYQIFHNCIFDNVKIDCSLLKNNFGLGMKKGIYYVKNGDIIDGVIQLYKILEEECFIQKSFLNVALLNYNFEPSINPVLILNCIDEIKKILENDILIRNDELLFVRQLYQYFYENKMIAPIVLYQLLIKIQEINNDFNFNSNIAYAKSREALLQIYNDLCLKFYEFCDMLQEIIINLPKYEEPLEVYIDYMDEPQISLSSLLNKCLPNTFKRLKGEQGSFHELIEMLPQGLEILNIFFQILGISTPIIYAEVKDKNKKKDNKNFNIEKKVNFNIFNSNTKESAKLIENTCKIIADSGMLNQDLQGYNNENIKNITIKYNINIHA